MANSHFEAPTQQRGPVENVPCWYELILIVYSIHQESSTMWHEGIPRTARETPVHIYLVKDTRANTGKQRYGRFMQDAVEDEDPRGGY